MKSTDLRAKARAIFGSAIAEPMPKQPNGAKALQQRANARPIPTYKVGGVVKKADGGKAPLRLTPAEKKMGDALMMTRKGKEVMDAQKRMESDKDMMRRKKQEAADKLLGITKKKDGGKACGAMKKGGKVQTSADTAKKLATEMGGMKKGGKAKDGLAVMIAIGKVKKPVKKAAGGTGRANMRSEPAAKNTRGLMARTAQVEPMPKEIVVTGQKMPTPPEPTRMPTPPKEIVVTGEKMPTPTRMPTPPTPPEPPTRVVYDTFNQPTGKRLTLSNLTGYKKGGAPVKKAVGGAGKTRKGQAPIKKAQGGAAKVRKGMMSPTGDIKQVVKPKKGIGGM